MNYSLATYRPLRPSREIGVCSAVLRDPKSGSSAAHAASVPTLREATQRFAEGTLKLLALLLFLFIGIGQAQAQFTGGNGRGDFMDAPAGSFNILENPAKFAGGIGRGDILDAPASSFTILDNPAKFVGGIGRGDIMDAPVSSFTILENPAKFAGGIGRGDFAFTNVPLFIPPPNVLVWFTPETVILNQPFAVVAEFRLNDVPYPLDGQVTIRAATGNLSGTLNVTSSNGRALFQDLTFDAFGTDSLSVDSFVVDEEPQTYPDVASPSISVTSNYTGGDGKGDDASLSDLQSLNGDLLLSWLGGTTGQLLDWFTATNWSPNTVPAPASPIRIPVTAHQPQIAGSSPDQNVLREGLTLIEDGAALTLEAGPLLKLEAGSVTETQGSGRIILQPGVTYQNLSASEPTLEVRQVITGQKGWRMLGSPVKSISYANLLDSLVTQGMVDSDFPALQPNVLWFDETDGGTTLQGWRKPGHVGNTAVLGRGHYVYVFGGAKIQGSSSNYADALPVTLSATGKEHNFLNDGAFNFSVTYTERSGSFQQLDQDKQEFSEISQVDQGFNMLANPTASVIDFYQEAGWTKTHIDNTLYVWDPALNSNNGGWRTYNGTTGNLDNGRLAPYQGFWVRANATSPILMLNSNAGKSAVPRAYLSRTWQEESSPASGESLVIPMRVEGMGMQAESWISFDPEGRPGPDPKDAYQLESLGDNWLLLYSYGSQRHRTPLQINNLDALDGDEKSIPLMLAASRGGREFTSDYTLHWEVPAGWPEGVNLLLMDHTQERAIDMRKANSHRFTFRAPENPGARMDAGKSGMKEIRAVIFPSPYETGDPQARSTDPNLKRRPFTIRVGKFIPEDGPEYRPDLPKLYPPVPNPFRTETRIRYYLPYEMKAQVLISDMQGRRVAEFPMALQKPGMHELDYAPEGMRLAAGMYLVQLITEEHVLNQRLIKN